MSISSTHCELLALAVAACSSSVPAASRADLEPASGPSWLDHLGLDIDQTVLGRLGDGGTAPATSPSRTSGGELYRLLCRSCHGLDARGQPPEVGSAVAGAAAASPDVLARQMRERGTPITPAMAASLTRDARVAIQHRLEQGGTRMPPFAYLHPDESEALVRYLEQLAGSSVEQQEIRESRLRIGELVVRGTCHICHAATAEDRGSRVGELPVPTLASFTRYASAWLVYKVRHGSRLDVGPSSSELIPRPAPTRMPIMPYLGDDELVAAFDYLEAVPPITARRN